MERVEKRVSGRFLLPVFAALEWLMVLPATVFLSAAAFRGLQPVQYEPARTCAAIVAWTVAHVSRSGAAILFIGMPGAVILAGGGTLLRIWRQDAALRQDSAMTFAILRPHLTVCLLTAAVLLAGAVLAAVAAHNVKD